MSAPRPCRIPAACRAKGEGLCVACGKRNGARRASAASPHTSPAVRAEARRIRLMEGLAFDAIDAKLCLSRGTARWACRDFPSGVGLLRVDARKDVCAKNLASSHAARRAERDAWAARAVEMRLAGHTLKEIAAKLGRAVQTVGRATAHLGVSRRGRIKAKVATPSGDRRIPPWAVRAGLSTDYRDVLRVQGEHAAASHCRALLREMRASA